MKGTKKERRHQRYLKNVQKEKDHKKEAWERGKLIEENHNGESYSPEYTVELEERLRTIISGILPQTAGMDSESSAEFILLKFRLYRQKIRDYILHYPRSLPKSETYEYLKRAIETYWDTPDKLGEVL